MQVVHCMRASKRTGNAKCETHFFATQVEEDSSRNQGEEEHGDHRQRESVSKDCVLSLLPRGGMVVGDDLPDVSLLSPVAIGDESFHEVALLPLPCSSLSGL